MHRSFSVTVELDRRILKAKPKGRRWNIVKKCEQHAVIELRSAPCRPLKVRSHTLGHTSGPGPEGNSVASFQPIVKLMVDSLPPVLARLEIISRPQVEVSLPLKKVCNLRDARAVFLNIRGEYSKIKRAPCVLSYLQGVDISRKHLLACLYGIVTLKRDPK